MIPTEEADKSPNICIRMLECLFNVAGFREVPGSFVPRVKRFFNRPSRESFLSIYISVSCVGRPSELLTDTCGRGKVYMGWKTAPGPPAAPASIKSLSCKCSARGAAGCFAVVINLQGRTQHVWPTLKNVQVRLFFS